MMSFVRCPPSIIANFASALLFMPVLVLVGGAVGGEAAGASTGPRAELIDNGEYLVRAGDCIACHTAPAGKLFAGGRAMPTPFGTLYTSNITPDNETGIGSWTGDQFYKMMHTGRFPDGGLLYPAMPFSSYTKVTRADCDAIFAYLRSVPPVRPAEPAARPALSIQQPPAHPGLAHTVFPGRRIPAEPGQIGRVEPRRLSRRGAGALRNVPLADQRPRRQLGIEGVRGRADPDAELVRALAHLEQGASRRSSTCSATGCCNAAPSTARWRKSHSTACNI